MTTHSVGENCRFRGPEEGAKLLGLGMARRLEGRGPEGEKKGSEGGRPPGPGFCFHQKVCDIRREQGAGGL